MLVPSTSPTRFAEAKLFRIYFEQIAILFLKCLDMTHKLPSVVLKVKIMFYFA